MGRFSLPLLLFAAAGGLYYLTDLDRTSPIALDAVELTTRVGFPLYAPVALLATVLAFVAALKSLPSAKPPPRRTSPMQAPPTSPLVAGADWYLQCRARAEALPLAPNGEIRFDEAWDLPFSLRLRQTTMEQARRRLDAFITFLHSIPRPHKARVTIESSPDVTLAHHHLVAAHLKRRFPEGAFYVMEHGGGVDIVFSEPDVRWSSRGQ